MQALKALCEIRLEKDDLAGLIEEAIKPGKATRAAAKQTGLWPSPDDFRRGPLGEDSSGLSYFHFDLHLCTEGAPLPFTSQAPFCSLPLYPICHHGSHAVPNGLPLSKDFRDLSY